MRAKKMGFTFWPTLYNRSLLAVSSSRWIFSTRTCWWIYIGPRHFS